MIHVRVNQRPMERVIRVVLGLVLLFPAWEIWLPGTVAFGLWVLGALALFTGTTGWCPLYAASGRGRHDPGRRDTTWRRVRAEP